MFTSDLTKAVLSCAQAFRDQELGRWRDPKNPDWVVYRDESSYDPNNGRCIVAVNEKTAERYRFQEKWELLHPAAQNYFAAHPASRKLPTAVGAIIEGNGLRLHLIGSGKGWWFDPARGNYKTNNQAVAFLGPDWRVIHEGMEEER